MSQSEVKTFFITGGAGFIGSSLTRFLVQSTPHKVINFDALTYAGSLESLRDIAEDPSYTFIHQDIRNPESIKEALATHRPDVVMHLAAESHVDRSIDSPSDFIETNILGTYNLLQQVRGYWNQLSGPKKDQFIFHHISTDEVFGDLTVEDPAFNEDSPYDPSSPYSASKASSDHLVRSWGRTFGLPIIVTNTSNNYGPRQFPEKLIPHMIISALSGKNLPIYGKGLQIRDWIHVDDHIEALYLVVTKGRKGETYNIGGNCEKTNLNVVETICSLLDEKCERLCPPNVKSFSDLITFVQDRPGHDFRYAIDCNKMKAELGWSPKRTFSEGLEDTINWYLDNKTWWENILNKKYKVERIGTHTRTSI